MPVSDEPFVGTDRLIAGADQPVAGADQPVAGANKAHTQAYQPQAYQQPGGAGVAPSTSSTSSVIAIANTPSLNAASGSML